MSDFREALWKNNGGLKEASLKYVGQGLQRREVLDFLTRDFPLYAWSLRALDTRFRHCDIFFNDGAGKVDHVMRAVKTELNGPGKQLHNLSCEARDGTYNHARTVLSALVLQEISHYDFILDSQLGWMHVL